MALGIFCQVMILYIQVVLLHARMFCGYELKHLGLSSVE